MRPLGGQAEQVSPAPSLSASQPGVARSLGERQGLGDGNRDQGELGSFLFCKYFHWNPHLEVVLEKIFNQSFRLLQNLSEKK